MAGQQRQQIGQAVAQFAAVEDQVDGAVLQQKLAALKAGRQFFPDRLFDHPWTGKTDQSLGFGDIDVAQQRQAGGDAAGGWMRQHRDVRDAVLGQPGEHGAGFSHLHQRDQRFLHSRATAGGKADEGDVFLQGDSSGTDETFADHRPHRAGHELEFESGGDHRHALEQATHGDQSVFFLAGFLCLSQAVLVFLAVLELEEIGRFDILADFARIGFVQKTVQALAGTKVHVMAAFGTNLQIALQFDPIQHRPAFLALAPQAFGNLVLVAAVGADAGGNEFFVPAHATGSGFREDLRRSR